MSGFLGGGRCAKRVAGNSTATLRLLLAPALLPSLCGPKSCVLKGSAAVTRSSKVGSWAKQGSPACDGCARAAEIECAEPAVHLPRQVTTGSRHLLHRHTRFYGAIEALGGPELRAGACALPSVDDSL